jgi:aminomethyltransferase
VKKTPLFECHESLGGKMVQFAGYLLPIQYEGLIKEHLAVRAEAGLFDVSHMGEVMFNGADALANIQNLVSNDLSTLQNGRVRYSPMLNDRGGVIDDVLVYRISQEKHMMVVNASNRDKDISWIREHVFGHCDVTDISDSIAQIALQGPCSYEILSELSDTAPLPDKYYSFNDKVNLAGEDCLISRTGYTGEDGFELYCGNESAKRLWTLLLDAGHSYGLTPCGLGARDTLRMEAAMPLYGHEMTDDITPIEAGLSGFVSMNKAYFIGKEALLNYGEPNKIRVGLQTIERGIIREDTLLYAKNLEVGRTTSGTYAPFLGKAVALALVNKTQSQIGTILEAEVRGRRVACEVVPLPFYKRNR